MQEIKIIRQLIGQARLKDAIKRLLQLDTAYNNAIIGLQTRLATLKKKEMIGVINNADANVERNQVNSSLLDLLSMIEEELANPVPDFNIKDGSCFEKIIDRNGLTRIDWLTKGIEKAKSVCKIHTSDGYIGTGFLIKGGYLFTNNHVINSASIAQYSKVEFGYDSTDTPSSFYHLDHNSFVTSENLDFTMVKVKDNATGKQLEEWGVLTINEMPPSANDALVIIQHPRGRSKELAFSDGNISLWEHRLHYKVTTEPGSSGSPVFDINWNVVAIHHAGGDLVINARGDRKKVNEGILFKNIQEYIGENLNDLAENAITGLIPPLPPTSNNEDSGSEDFSKPIKIMLVYHPKDAEFAEGIDSHLIMQKRNGNIDLFDIQNDIPPDANKGKLLDETLSDSNILLVLISNNLYRRETIKLALAIEKLVSVKKVIPIKVAPFDLNGTSFEKLQGLPLDGLSISESTNLDQTLYQISVALSRLIKGMIG